MSLTFGFYNSVNNDRKYDATQMSSIFDGIIRDGVFASIGSALVVTADTGSTVKVGTGRAWFNHTWTLNDAILPLRADESELLLDRIDAVVLEVNASDDARRNSIKMVKGIAAKNPVRPTMVNDEFVHQYPLCYIYRAANSTNITQADITNTVGTSECPFVTGILEVLTADEIIVQWKAQFDEWMQSEQDNYDEWYATMIAALEANSAALDMWIADEQNKFTAWFNDIKAQFSGEGFENLQEQIDNLTDDLENYALKSELATANIATFSYVNGDYTSPSVTGAYKITIPEEVMVNLEIAFRSYSYSCRYSVSGYTYTGNNWHNPAAVLEPIGSKLPAYLYTNQAKTEHYIVIGRIDSVNQYPQIDVFDAGIGYGGDLEKLRDGIKIEVVTDISDLTLNNSLQQHYLTNTSITFSNGVLTINLD